MWVDSELAFPELKGLSNGEKLQVLIENGYGCDRGINGGILVSVPDDFPWRYQQINSMVSNVANEWWSSLNLFEKIYWRARIKLGKLFEYVRKRVNV